MIPKDFTAQENIVAKCLDELGLRYSQQVPIGKYTVDFLLEDCIILEADGIFGHFRDSDKQRDSALYEYNKRIISIGHIKEETKEKIKHEIIGFLLCLEFKV